MVAICYLATVTIFFVLKFFVMFFLFFFLFIASCLTISLLSILCIVKISLK